MSDHRPLPARPDLGHLRREAKARLAAGEVPTLARAQLAVARDYGFASWPRLKLHVEATTLDAAQRIRRFVESACSSNPALARALLAADPELPTRDLACACVAGDAATVARELAAAPRRVSASLPPLEMPPILLACFSRLGRGDPSRAAGIRAVVTALLDAGADADARVDRHGWIQSTLYGAAGIAGDPALTRMLLDAGADPDDDGPEHSVGEALYHACEQSDPECARLLIAAGTRRSVVDYCLGRALNFPNVAMIRVFCEGGARPTAAHLDEAVWRRRGVKTVALLLDAGAPADGDPGGAAPLATAVRWGETAVAELLRARGADEDRVTDADRALGALLSGGDPELPGEVRPRLTALLAEAIERADPEATRRLLAAGAPVDGEPGEEHPPIGVAAWHGHAAVVAVLAEHGAALAHGDGSAVGAALHGSRHCGHPEGGPTMAPRDEIDLRRYRETLDILLAAGAPVPERLGSSGPRTVNMLADLGVLR